MSQKRQPEAPSASPGCSGGSCSSSSSSGGGGGGGGGRSGSPVEKKRQKTRLKGVISEVMRVNHLQRLIMAIEPLVRTVVREEVNLAFSNYISQMTRQDEKIEYPSASKILRLQFLNKLSLPIFTGAKIEGENSSAINISLNDALTGQAVTLAGQALKVELVVLEGDFEGVEGGNWSAQYFSCNILREREGKKQLLSGDPTVDLSQGIGSVGELTFTDNSSWTRSRKFRLGARIGDGYFDGIRIREAVTESFSVKDHRGELYKKHYPPALEDEVWRLEKIGKDGAFHKRLCKEKINTVKDFLTVLCIDASRLRNILSSMSAKMWDLTIEHAKTCDVGTKVHVYYPDGVTDSGIIFNVIGEVKGFLSERKFVPAHDLSDKDKEEASAAVKLLHGHWDKSFSCDMETLLSNPSGIFRMMAPSLEAERIGFQVQADADCFPLDQSAITISPGMFSLEESLHSTPTMDEQLQQEMQMICSERLWEENRPVMSPIMSKSLGPSVMDDFTDNMLPSIGEPSDLASVLRGFIAVSTQTLSRPGRPYRGWRMLSCVLGLIFYVKRIAALRRKTPGK